MQKQNTTQINGITPVTPNFLNQTE
jgi:hypothetical protein